MTTDPLIVAIADVVADHLDCDGDASTGAWRYICQCGEVMQADDIDEATEAHARHQGETVLAAIAATGRLAEPGAILPLAVPPTPDNPGETWQEWGYRITLPDGRTVDHYEEDEGCWDQNDAAKMMADALNDYEDGCTAVLIRRTAWYATTAWQPTQPAGGDG